MRFGKRSPVEVRVGNVHEATIGRYSAIVPEFWGWKGITVDVYYSLRDGFTPAQGQTPDMTTFSFYVTRHSKVFGSGKPAYKNSVTIRFLPENEEKKKLEEIINRRFNSMPLLRRALRTESPV